MKEGLLHRGRRNLAHYQGIGVKTSYVVGAVQRRMTKRRRRRVLNKLLSSDPVLMITEICTVLDIAVPDELRLVKAKPVTETSVFQLVKNRHDVPTIGDDPQYFGEVFAANLRLNLGRFKPFYASISSVDHSDLQLVEMFVEWLYVFKPLGFHYDDYFGYELYDKSVDQALAFISQHDRRRIARVCRDPGYQEVFKNKALFNQRFSHYVHRDYLDTTSCSFEEFEEFCAKFPRFFAKPIRGSVGTGARIMESDNVSRLWKTCRKDSLLVEQIIDQHPDLAAVNGDTLNTIRVYSLLTGDDEPLITLAGIRFGRLGAVVDNFHAGGIAVGVDIETGRVVTDGVDRSLTRFARHPDSDLPFKGFHVPRWSDVLEAVRKACLSIPQIRSIGWDLSVTAPGQVEFVEGNDRPDFDVTQIVDQVGKKHLYDPHMNALEKLGLSSGKK